MNTVWQQGADLPRFETLGQDMHTDILIIGGGIDGLLCAYKLGQWLGMVWMEKSIGEHPDTPKEFIPYPEIKK